MNPIIGRELLGMLRTRRALAVQVALVALLAVLVLARWPSDSRVDLSGEQAGVVFSAFAYGLLGCVLLLAPIFPATTIVRERQQGTLALLLNSPMSPASILFGKLVGVMGFAVILLILSVPAAAACYTMGGIDFVRQVVPVYGLLFLVALQYSALGLLISSYAASIDSALRLTYGAILLLAVVTLGPYQFLKGHAWGPWLDLLEWSRCVSPIPAVMELLGQGDMGTAGILSRGGQATRYAILAVISGVGLLGWTGSRLNRRLVDRPRAVRAATDDMSAAEQSRRRKIYVIDPLRRTKAIGDHTNPVMVKEFRTRRFGRSYWLIRLIGGCLIVSLGLMLATARSTETWGPTAMGAVVVVLQMSLIVLLTPSLASGLISSERESGGWTLLKSTPLSVPTIVVGKLLSVGWTLLLLLLSTLPAYAMMYVIEYRDPTALSTSRVPLIVFSLVLTAFFSLLVSAAVSSLFRRTAPATATSYALLMGLCAGTMLFWFGENAPFSHTTVERALRLNPVASALSLLNAPGFRDYSLVPFNWWVLAIGCLVSLAVLVVRTWRLTQPD